MIPPSRPLSALAPHLPWVELATLPTPLRAQNLDRAEILIKDDGASGSLYGGNKVRKLEFLLGDALARGAARVATVGAVGSNHALATATWARALGIATDVIHFPQPPTAHVAENLAAIASQGARLYPCASRLTLPLALLGAQLSARLPSRRTAWIPGGGTSPLGAMGYVNAWLELVEQLDATGLAMPSTVYVAAGTGGTLAGLIAGAAIAGRPVRIVGVRVVDRLVCNARVVARLVDQIAESLPSTPRTLLRKGRAQVEWMVRHDQFGAGYGVSTPAALEAVTAARRDLGLYAETTYTAKTLAALRSDLRDGESGDRPLYWHTLNDRPLAALTASDFDPAALHRRYRRYFEAHALPGHS